MRGVSGREWSAPELGHASDLVTHVMRSRGIGPDDEEAFLRPKIREALPDPHILLGMREACVRLADDVRSGRTVGIYTDYDADGATSAGVLGRWLRSCGNPHRSLVVPDRKVHGYGPNAELLTGMFERDAAETVFVLDSGTVAAGVFAELPERDRRSVFVIDHHMPSGPLPDVGAVVNPNRADQPGGYGHLAAVGVTFLLCVGAQRELIRSGHAARESMQGLMDLLDYVAVGTVADVVPLTGINRAFVHHGIRRVSRDPATPLGALLASAGKRGDAPLSASDFGFTIGPRLNAEGRIGDPDAAARFLLETDPELIRAGAARLSETNRLRQDMEKAATAVAIADAESRPRTGVIIAVTDGHEGVVGISASRLKDRYDAPTVVLTLTPEGVLKGSARSLDGFNIGEAIHDAAHAGIIIRGGGHAMAGGLTLRPDRLDDLRAHMNAAVADSDLGRGGPASRYDAIMPVSGVSVGTCRDLSVLAPFGRDNPEPRLVLTGAVVESVRIMSDKHVKARITNARGKKVLDAILWGGVGTPTGERMLGSEGVTLTIAGRLEINDYRGEEGLQMIVDDVLDAPSPSPEVVFS